MDEGGRVGWMRWSCHAGTVAVYMTVYGWLSKVVDKRAGDTCLVLTCMLTCDQTSPLNRGWKELQSGRGYKKVTKYQAAVTKQTSCFGFKAGGRREED